MDTEAPTVDTDTSEPDTTIEPPEFDEVMDGGVGCLSLVIVALLAAASTFVVLSI